MQPYGILIVGAGQAGARAAEAIRKTGFTGTVALVGEEPHLPYERPPLSKGIIGGTKPAEAATVLRPDFFADARIDLHRGVRVERIDPLLHHVACDDGRILHYEKLLLCTGARVRILPTAPPGQPGIFYLRTMDEALSLGRSLKGVKKVVAIGGGFLGLEVAATARQLGLEVVLIEAAPNLLERSMAPQIAKTIEDIHRRNGVDIRLNVTVSDVQADADRTIVTLSDGQQLPAGAVVVAIGIVPNVELAESAGAAVDNGVVVDEFGRTTITDLFAAGDVTNHPNAFLRRRLRLESWQNAQNQAIAVARCICGELRPYTELPWFWSDQYGFNIQTLGIPQKTDHVVLRGDATGSRFMYLNVQDEVLVGGTTFNMGGEMAPLRKLVQASAKVPLDVLADPTKKFREIIAAFPPG